jgi:hypothetical protein
MERPQTDETDHPQPLPPASAPNLEAYGLDSEEQVGRVLNRSVSTLRRWRAAHRGPAFVVIGREVYYRRAAIAEWLLKPEQGFEDNKKRKSGPHR